MSNSNSAEVWLDERRWEARKARQKQETQKSLSVFRLWEGGKCRCMATESPQDILGTASLLHQCLGECGGSARTFAQKILGGHEISPERFDLLAQERLRSTGDAVEVFDLDFDKQILTTVDPFLDDWTSFWFQDVYAAVDAAFREKGRPRTERLNKLMERLAENECFDQYASAKGPAGASARRPSLSGQTGTQGPAPELSGGLCQRCGPDGSVRPGGHTW